MIASPDENEAIRSILEENGLPFAWLGANERHYTWKWIAGLFGDLGINTASHARIAPTYITQTKR